MTLFGRFNGLIIAAALALIGAELVAHWWHQVSPHVIGAYAPMTCADYKAFSDNLDKFANMYFGWILTALVMMVVGLGSVLDAIITCVGVAIRFISSKWRKARDTAAVR